MACKKPKTPDWAVDRAVELMRKEELILGSYLRMKQAFAKYIAENEEPPVDPYVLRAREIYIETTKESYSDIPLKAFTIGVALGNYDNDPAIKSIVKALKEKKE